MPQRPMFAGRAGLLPLPAGDQSVAVVWEARTAALIGEEDIWTLVAVVMAGLVNGPAARGGVLGPGAASSIDLIGLAQLAGTVLVRTV